MQINTPFKLEFISLKTENFKNKKKNFIKHLKSYPEKKYPNFTSNRGNKGLADIAAKIFEKEFLMLSNHFKSSINLYDAWTASYKKGDYHIPHNHGSTGYCGILYLDMHKKSPVTCYMQPWNSEKDRTVIYQPSAVEGDIVVVPQFIKHYTHPNTNNFKKRILSFDFKLLTTGAEQ